MSKMDARRLRNIDVLNVGIRSSECAGKKKRKAIDCEQEAVVVELNACAEFCEPTAVIGWHLGGKALERDLHEFKIMPRFGESF